jgi:hypothetical protein
MRNSDAFKEEVNRGTRVDSRKEAPTSVFSFKRERDV